MRADPLRLAQLTQRLQIYGRQSPRKGAPATCQLAVLHISPLKPTKLIAVGQSLQFVHAKPAHPSLCSLHAGWPPQHAACPQSSFPPPHPTPHPHPPPPPSPRPTTAPTHPPTPPLPGIWTSVACSTYKQLGRRSSWGPTGWCCTVGRWGWRLHSQCSLALHTPRLHKARKSQLHSEAIGWLHC
jgi:hypothetical protein